MPSSNLSDNRDGMPQSMLKVEATEGTPMITNRKQASSVPTVKIVASAGPTRNVNINTMNAMLTLRYSVVNLNPLIVRLV